MSWVKSYRIAIVSQVFKLNVCEDAHADTFDLVVHFSVDSCTGRAYKNVEVHHKTVHSALNREKSIQIAGEKLRGFGYLLLAVEALFVFGKLAKRVNVVCLCYCFHFSFFLV